MLLLQKKPAQNEVDKRVSLESRLDASVNKKITEFNAFKTIMAERRDKIELEFINFCLETENRRNELVNEISTLELRREQALLPIKTELEELERAKIAQRELLDDINDKIAEQKEISSRNAKLTNKINKREQQIIKTEQETENLHHEAVKLVAKHIQQEKELTNLKATLETRFQAAMLEITAKEEKLKETEKALKTLISENEATKLRLVKMEKRIESKQATLKAAYEEIKYGTDRRK